jgi:hypothetical protein
MAFIEIKKKRRMRGGIRNVGQITIEDLWFGLWPKMEKALFPPLFLPHLIFSHCFFLLFFLDTSSHQSHSNPLSFSFHLFYWINTKKCIHFSFPILNLNFRF